MAKAVSGLLFTAARCSHLFATLPIATETCRDARLPRLRTSLCRSSTRRPIMPASRHARRSAAELALLNTACGCLCAEPRFEEKDGAAAQMRRLAPLCGPEFVLQLALYVRDDLGIRSTANFLLAPSFCSKRGSAQRQPQAVLRRASSAALRRAWREAGMIGSPRQVSAAIASPRARCGRRDKSRSRRKRECERAAVKSAGSGV